MVFAHRLNPHAAAFWLLALTLLLLPVGLGGNRPIAFGLAQIGLAGFFACYALAMPPHHPWPTRLKVALALFGITLAWAWLQTVSFTPTAWHHPLWAEGAALIPGLQGSVSLTPEASLLALARLATYGLMLAAVWLLARDPTQAQRLLAMLWLTGLALCVVALLQHVISPDTILWLHKWDYAKDVVGTFVNRNHFADYAGLVFITGFALMWQSLRRRLREARPGQAFKVFQQWLFKNGAAYGGALMVVALTLWLSHSRAGLVCTLLGLVVYVFSFLVYQRRWERVWLGTGMAVLLVLFTLAHVAGEGRFSTLFNDYSSGDRVKVYELTAGAVQDNPWFGHGLGSFESAFHLYRDTRLIMGDLGFNRAHNDWLESAFDLGIPAALLLVAAVGLAVSGCWHGVRTRHKNGIYPALGLAASAMVLGHALFDFSLQIPGVVATWLLLLGCGLAQSWRLRTDERMP